MFGVPPESYLLDGTNLVGQAGTCVIGAMGLDFGLNFYILGDAFLSNYY